MANRYWIANIGTTNQEFATANNWADNADGTGANTAPTAGDHVHFGHATTLAAGKGFGSCELGANTGALEKFTSYEGYNAVEVISTFSILGTGYFTPNPVNSVDLVEIGFKVGMVITVTGAANAGNNSTFEIASLTGNQIQVTSATGMVNETGSPPTLTIKYTPVLDLKGKILNITAPTGGSLMTMDSVIVNSTGSGIINLSGATVGNRYFLCGSNQNFLNRDTITMNFTGGGTTIYFDDGVYPVVQLSGGTYTCGYIIPTSKTHGAVKFYKFKEQVASTWSAGTGSIIDRTKKKFELASTTSFVLLTTLFDADYSTWSFNCDNAFPFPVSGDTTSYASGFVAKWYNVIIQNTAHSASNKASILQRKNLQLNSLTVEEGGQIIGHIGTTVAGGDGGSSTITCVTRPIIRGSWNFVQIADGIYSSVLTDAYPITPSHGIRGRIQFSDDGGAFFSDVKLNWDMDSSSLRTCDGAYMMSSFYQFCQTYAAASGNGNNDTIWITNATPSVPYFTDNQGNHHNLLAGGGGGGTDEKVKINALDGTAGYLENKIIAGTGISSSLAIAAPFGTQMTFENDSRAFKTIAVAGQTDVVADGIADTLTLAAGSNMTITTNASTDTITFASSGGGGGGGVTVQDEGVTLATTATTLNFVGAGVVASGTGATKTITIAGGGGGGTTEVVEFVNSNTTINMNTTIAVCASNTDCTAKAGVVGQAWSGMSPSIFQNYDFTSTGVLNGGSAFKGLIDVPAPTVGRKLTLVIPQPSNGRLLPQGITQITCTGQANAFIGHDLVGMLNGEDGSAQTGSQVILPEQYLYRGWTDSAGGIERRINTRANLGHHAITLVGVPAPTGNDAALVIANLGRSDVTMGDVVDSAKWWVETNNEFLWDVPADGANPSDYYFDDRGWRASAWGQLYVVC